MTCAPCGAADAADDDGDGGESNWHWLDEWCFWCTRFEVNSHSRMSAIGFGTFNLSGFCVTMICFSGFMKYFVSLHAR